MIVGGTFSVPVTTSSTLIVGYSNARKSITFHPPPNNRVTIDDSPGVTLDNGPTLQQGQAPLTYRREDYGDLVSGPFYSIANLATTLGYSESMYYD